MKRRENAQTPHNMENLQQNLQKTGTYAQIVVWPAKKMSKNRITIAQLL